MSLINKGLLIRPISAQDEERMTEFHKNLSPESIYFRYFHPFSLSARTTHARLAKICAGEDRNTNVLVCEKFELGSVKIVGVGRLVRMSDQQSGEIAIIVEDKFQNIGIGTELCRQIIQIASDQNLKFLFAYIMENNIKMKSLCEKMGFKLKHSSEGLVAVKELESGLKEYSNF